MVYYCRCSQLPTSNIRTSPTANLIFLSFCLSHRTTQDLTRLKLSRQLDLRFPSVAQDPFQSSRAVGRIPVSSGVELTPSFCHQLQMWGESCHLEATHIPCHVVPPSAKAATEKPVTQNLLFLISNFFCV